MIRILLNALPTELGGGATVWRALVEGAGACSDDVAFLIVTGSEHVADLVAKGNAAVEVELVRRRTGSWRGELHALSKHGRSWRADVAIAHNRTSMVRLPQIALHVNLTRFLPPPESGRDWRERLRDGLSKRSLRRAQANVFESRFLLDSARRRFPDVNIANPSVVYVGLDRQWLVSPSARVLSAHDRGPAILAVTMPNPHKDNDVLVDVLSELDALTNVKWRLRIAGGRASDGFPDVVERARLLGVEDRVEFLGFVPRDGLATVVDRSFALVSPSRIESFAMVPLEAMARGTPVVVAESTSMPESVGSIGRLVPARDPKRMAAEVAALWSDLSHWSRASVASRIWAAGFTWESFAAHVVGVARSLANLHQVT